MADVRRYELEELANRPGTYYNPTTEVVIVVDDSTAIETGLVDEDDDMEWVLLGDEPAVDEHKRDELVDALRDPQRRHRARDRRRGRRGRGRARARPGRRLLA